MKAKPEEKLEETIQRGIAGTVLNLVINHYIYFGDPKYGTKVTLQGDLHIPSVWRNADSSQLSHYLSRVFDEDTELDEKEALFRTFSQEMGFQEDSHELGQKELAKKYSDGMQKLLSRPEPGRCFYNDELNQYASRCHSSVLLMIHNFNRAVDLGLLEHRVSSERDSIYQRLSESPFEQVDRFCKELLAGALNQQIYSRV